MTQISVEWVFNSGDMGSLAPAVTRPPVTKLP
jgi:hypothetical protein